MADSITLDKLRGHLAFFKKMYDVVRLVDPIHKRVIDYHGQMYRETDDICYEYWKNGKICDNCISVRAYRDNKSYLKLEKSAESIMMVTALPVENAATPTILELLKNATDSLMIGLDSDSDDHLMVDFMIKMNDLVIKDKLTGLFNRRYVDERLPVDIVKSTLDDVPLSVIFMDVDNLKEINDVYGHVFGDQTIQGITNAVLRCIRADTDWAARYGGDEFLICLNNTSTEVAFQIAERIRSEIEDLEITNHDWKLSSTVSLGIYTMHGEALTAEEIISLADRKMYEAKQHGKNFTMGIDK